MTRGQHMKEARLNAGLTINELAKLSTVSGTTISRLERGERLGNVETIVLLAKALRLSLDAYLGDEQTTPPAKKPERVEVFVPRISAREDPNLFIGVNGVNYLLPKGRKLMVPVAVAEELFRSRRAAARFDESKEILRGKRSEADENHDQQAGLRHMPAQPGLQISGAEDQA